MKHRPKRLRWKEYDYGVSNSGLFRVSDRMLRRMRPDLFGFRGWLRQRISRLTCRWTVRDFFREQLWLGSIQAAIVMSVEP
ncbi:MAG TPA: hypothetical protein VN541_14795, partial [Tepidisphaeraceae bacterium]|nr:hypothetical protein [Tepidisphaeraceae bacterium]